MHPIQRFTLVLLPVAFAFQASRQEAAAAGQLSTASGQGPETPVLGPETAPSSDGDGVALLQETIQTFEPNSSGVLEILSRPLESVGAETQKFGDFLQHEGSRLTQANLNSELTAASAAGADLAKNLQTLAVRSLHAKGKSGPASAFPWRHVVQRDRSEDGSAQEAAVRFPVSGSRSSLASLPLCCFMISVFFAISRKTGDSFSFPRLSLSAARSSFSGFLGLGEQGRMALISRCLHFVPSSHDELELALGNAIAVHTKKFDRPQGISVWDGTVATFSTLVGTGLLAMPHAFSLAGLMAVPLTMFFVACSAYTAHLMVWAMQEVPGKHSEHLGWGALVGAAFGPRAQIAINAFLVIELWGYLLSATVCAAMNITQLWEHITAPFAIGLAVCGAYWLSFVPAATMTQISVSSNMCFLVCCIMFLFTGLCLPQEAPASDVQLVKPNGILLAAGILVYSPAGHSFYPALMQKMEEPELYPVCIRRAYLAACLLYLAMAVPGYLLFGNMAQPSAVSNIGVDLKMAAIPGLGWMNSVAALAMTLKMIPSQSLTLMPLTRAVEDLCCGTFKGSLTKSLAGPICLLLSAAAALAYANEMAVLINLIGSVFCMNVSFVMPVACYWKLTSKPVGILRQLLFLGLLVMGSTFAVLGVVVSL